MLTSFSVLWDSGYKFALSIRPRIDRIGRMVVLPGSKSAGQGTFEKLGDEVGISREQFEVTNELPNMSMGAVLAIELVEL